MNAAAPRRLDLRPGEDPHTDPLISALIEKLPKTGGPWPIEQRLVWLRMATMSFDLAYGVDAPIEIGLAGVPRVMAVDAGSAPARAATRVADAPGGGPRLDRKRQADQKFVVDLDGIAFGPKGPIQPAELNGEYLWEFRSGEPGLETIIWADGAPRAPQELVGLMIMKG